MPTIIPPFPLLFPDTKQVTPNITNAKMPIITAQIPDAGCFLSVSLNSPSFFPASHIYLYFLLFFFLLFFPVLCLNINIQIAKHIYPNIPPDVFNITSSTSHEPSFDISWISSTVTEHSIHINVTLNILLFLYDSTGSTNPSGIKHKTFPTIFKRT